MNIKMKMRRGESGCEVIATFGAQEDAQTVGEAIRSFLTLSGHEVETECCEEGDGACPSVALRCLRVKHNLTQSEFADKLGARQNIVSDMERGARPISVKMAKKIEKIFGAPYKQFI